jgi:hypothetical protein
MKSSRRPNTEDKTELVTFDIADKRGRTIGAKIHTFNAVFTPATEDMTSWYNMDPGFYFGLNVHATRNDVTYGPIQNDKYFKTWELRDLAIGQYLKDARARASKIK